MIFRSTSYRCLHKLLDLCSRSHKLVVILRDGIGRAIPWDATSARHRCRGHFSSWNAIAFSVKVSPDCIVFNILVVCRRPTDLYYFYFIQLSQNALIPISRSARIVQVAIESWEKTILRSSWSEKNFLLTNRKRICIGEYLSRNPQNLDSSNRRICGTESSNSMLCFERGPSSFSDNSWKRTIYKSKSRPRSRMHFQRWTRTAMLSREKVTSTSRK